MKVFAILLAILLVLSLPFRAQAQAPTVIYRTAAPLAIASGSSWSFDGTCTTASWCYRVPVDSTAVTSGSTILVSFSYDSTGANQTFTVTDDQGNSYVNDVTSAVLNTKTMKMYRATNVTAGASYVNVRQTGGTQNALWQISIAVVKDANTLDVSSCNTATSATITAGSMTPTVSGDFIFQAKYSTTQTSQTASFTAGSQANITWGLLSELLGDGVATQSGVYNSTSAINPTFTQAASDAYISCAVALKPNVAGSVPIVLPRVINQEHDATPKVAANPWKLGVVVDTPNTAVYIHYVGNDALSSPFITSTPSPDIGWTASGADFAGSNGHNHDNIYCAKWTTPPGTVLISIQRTANTNDTINMVYVVLGATCNLDVDDGGLTANQASQVSTLVICTSTCLTPTKQNDFILGGGGQFFCTGTSLVLPSGGHFATAWFNGNTIDGPTQTDENNFWWYAFNSSLSQLNISIGESCGQAEGVWAHRTAAYQAATIPIVAPAPVLFAGRE
jgi:hypothetical protein